MSKPTPTSRATRSRISSPFIPSQSASNGSSAPPARAQTMLDRWIEPPLADPIASFAEAGMERHGVVLNMAPLGTRPNIKALKAAAMMDPFEPVRRAPSTRRSAAASLATPEQVTTPEPPTVQASTKGEEPEVAPKTPKQQTSPKKHASRASISSQRAPSSSKPVPVTPRNDELPEPEPDYDMLDLKRTDRVVESAVQEALDAKRWCTAYALRVFYDENRSDPEMVRLHEAVYEERATRKELRGYVEGLRKKKAEGRRHKTAEHYFNTEATDPERSHRNTAKSAPFEEPLSPKTTVLGKRKSMSFPSGADSSAQTSVSPSRSPRRNPAVHVNKKRKSGTSSSETSNFPTPSEAINLNPPTEDEPIASLEVNGAADPITNGLDSPRRRPSLRKSSSLSSIASLSSDDEMKIETPIDINGNGTHKHHDADKDVHNGDGRQVHKAYATRKSRQPIAEPSATLPETFTSLTDPPHQASHLQHLPQSGWVEPPTDSTNSLAFSRLSKTAKKKHRIETSVANAQKKGRAKKATMSPTSLSLSNPLPSPSPVSTPISPSEIGMESRKRKAREMTSSLTATEVEDSYIRTPMPDEDPPAKRPLKVRLITSRAKSLVAQSNPTLPQLSSATLSHPIFSQDTAPNSRAASRASTPNTNGRPVRQPKGSGIRVKTSPMKKKGTLAGLPRASGERGSPTINGSTGQDDNDDYCSACGGNGDLVCCDGCTGSYHFKCVDPPMMEGALPDEWFCNMCFSLRSPPENTDDKGVFGRLVANLERRNPSAFHLPKSITGYFDNVKTGADGEYEEAVVPKPKVKAGYDEAPDYFRTKDSKGKTIFCHKCNQLASAPDRMIIPCTHCSLSWHLDCIDPPMAKEPPPGRAWKCPAHVDDLLSKVPGQLGPAHRFRKIKDTSAIKPALLRGVVNNGHIEIENTPSDDEDNEFYEQKEYGRVYILPEKGIKLDFISRVKENRQTPTATPTNQVNGTAEPPAPRAFSSYSTEQQQASLNLMSLASDNKDGTQILIDALIAEAPSSVAALIAQGDATNISQSASALTKADRNSLLAMKRFIESKLAEPSVDS